MMLLPTLFQEVNKEANIDCSLLINKLINQNNFFIDVANIVPNQPHGRPNKREHKHNSVMLTAVLNFQPFHASL